MKSIYTNGTSLAYLDEGRGPVTLLFLHGAFIDSSWWEAQVSYFKQRYRVLAPDWPGHGQSGRERADWSMAAFAGDLVALLKELELTNVILIAHSMGAEIALAALDKRPGSVLGLIVVDMVKNAGQELPEEFRARWDQILEEMKADPASTNEQYARMALVTGQTPAWLTERVAAAYREAYAPMAQQVVPEAFMAWEVEARCLPKLDKKLYLINVDYLPTNEEPLKRLLSAGYDLQVMPGTSHFPMVESPDELNRRLEMAIEKIEDAPDYVLRDAPKVATK